MGDGRRTRRLIGLVEALSAQPSASIPVASGGGAQTKAAYRLLDTPALDWRERLEVHTARTRERLAGQLVVLGIQDSTELDCTTQPSIAGLGRLRYEAQHGLYVHPTLVATAQGAALGVGDAGMWARAPQGKAPFQESGRGVEGYGSGADLAEARPGTRLGYVADREGDSRALMDYAERRGTPADWRVRAQHARNTPAGDKLWARLAKAEPLGELELWLRAGPGRRARWVRQTVGGRGVELAAGTGAPPLTITVVLARAESPPAGEQAMAWRLLTNRPAERLEAAAELIDWYRRRFLVEVVFRIFKSGCRVEALPLGTRERLQRALGIYLIIAGRSLQLVSWGRDGRDGPCEVVFDPAAWPAAGIVAHRRPPPPTPPNLGAMGRLVAGFGGFLGRTGEGPPGPKAIWEGMQQVQACAAGIAAARAAFIPSG